MSEAFAKPLRWWVEGDSLAMAAAVAALEEAGLDNEEAEAVQAWLTEPEHGHRDYPSGVLDVPFTGNQVAGWGRLAIRERHESWEEIGEKQIARQGGDRLLTMLFNAAAAAGVEDALHEVVAQIGRERAEDSVDWWYETEPGAVFQMARTTVGHV